MIVLIILALVGALILVVARLAAVEKEREEEKRGICADDKHEARRPKSLVDRRNGRDSNKT